MTDPVVIAAQTLQADISSSLTLQEKTHYTSYKQLSTDTDVLTRKLQMFHSRILDVENAAVEASTSSQKAKLQESLSSLMQAEKELNNRFDKIKTDSVNAVARNHKDERDRLIGGDEEALERRRKQYDPNAIRQETTKILRQMDSSMSEALTTTEETGKHLQSSGQTMRSSYNQSTQFQGYVGEARAALREWWRALGSENRWYYGSLIFFFVIVFIVWWRRVPLKAIFKVARYVTTKSVSLSRKLLSSSNSTNATESVQQELLSLVNDTIASNSTVSMNSSVT
ncbi:hypothetical protein BLNAU_675 [Blattamonas nauphoetae]|uniref:Sec20-domain-containing protein n=1 Tax=Blattamonas nauphoetae TaxID=2049346 RepID=A0ABQ9YKP5_9EUKA|nr:hypothetical protein BLNAU_675 [Blattamonas nauphoetae]